MLKHSIDENSENMLVFHFHIHYSVEHTFAFVSVWFSVVA